MFPVVLYPHHFRGISPTGRNAVPQTFKFPRTTESAASIPRTARSKTAGQAIVQPELRRVSGVLPSCCRKSAERVAILELRWTAENSWTLESVQKRGALRKERTSSELAPLVQAHCEHCNNLLPSAMLHGHASPTPPRLLRLWCLIFSAPAPTCNVFLEPRCTVCETRSFS